MMTARRLLAGITLAMIGVNGCAPVVLAPGALTGRYVARVALTAIDETGRTTNLGAADIASAALDGKPIPIAFTPAGELQLPEGDYASRRQFQVWLKDGGHVVMPLHQQTGTVSGHDLKFDATVHRQGGKAVLGSVLPASVMTTATDPTATIVGTYVSVQQANDLSANGSLAPLYDTGAKTTVTNLFVLLKALYPDVTFQLDWANTAANGFALTGTDGSKIVVINGALARQSALQTEGLAVIIASLANRFTPVAPLDSDYRTSLAACGYYAFASASRMIWQGSAWTSSAAAAYAQVKALLSLIPPEHALGDPGGQVDEPSIACRLQAMQAGIVFDDLPTCAGGPVLP